LERQAKPSSRSNPTRYERDASRDIQIPVVSLLIQKGSAAQSAPSRIRFLRETAPQMTLAYRVIFSDWQHHAKNSAMRFVRRRP
jgi:hypothetical protein